VSEVTSSQNVNNSNNVTGGGVHCDCEPYAVTFPAGQTSIPFDVPIIDDNAVEGDKNFRLTIMRKLLPNDVTRDKPGRATLTIVDDDCELYCR